MCRLNGGLEAGLTGGSEFGAGDVSASAGGLFGQSVTAGGLAG